MNKLTASERKTLNAAMKIITDRIPLGASWQFYAAHYKSGVSFSGCYFDSAGGQHSAMYGATFADLIAKGMVYEESASKNAAQIKAEKIHYLRKQLSELTGEIAA